MGYKFPYWNDWWIPQRFTRGVKKPKIILQKPFPNYWTILEGKYWMNSCHPFWWFFFPIFVICTGSSFSELFTLSSIKPRYDSDFDSDLPKFTQIVLGFLRFCRRGNPGMTRCREMATLPSGYILQRKVPSASSSGSLGFIVCMKCFRMVYSVPIRHTIPIL